MSGLSPTSYTMQQFQALAAVAYNAACIAAGVLPSNLGAGSSMGPLINANSQSATVLQAEVDLATANSRLLTIPLNQDGTPNPAVDAFLYPYSIPRLGGSAATTSCAIGTSSPPVSPMVIPVGMIVQRSSDGTQYVVTADASQGAYTSNAGGYANGGYTIPSDGTTTNVNTTLTCLTVGTLGNCPIGAINQVYSAPGNPAPQGIIVYGNAEAVINGIPVESDPAYIARFQVQSGTPKFGVRAAILSAVAAVQSGLIYQYGDVMNPDGSYHAAYFTIFVNIANSPTGPSPALISAVDAAIDSVRCGGIEFTVAGPTLVPVTVTGTTSILSGFNATNVLQNQVTAVQAYINGLGMKSDGSNTICSWSEVVSILNAVPGVASVATVQVNGGTVDLTAGFGYEFVAATTQAITS